MAFGVTVCELGLEGLARGFFLCLCMFLVD